MKGVFWKKVFSQLSVVVTINEELNVSGERLHASREAPGFASQTFQIMTQISIDGFHGIGFLFVGAHFIGSPIVEIVIRRKGIGVVVFGLRRSFQAGLQGFGGSFEHYIPAQDTACVSVNNGQDVDFVFFLPTKVNNSSNSAFFTVSGKGAFGSLAV